MPTNYTPYKPYSEVPNASMVPPAAAPAAPVVAPVAPVKPLTALTSSIPALDTTSVVQQPGATNMNLIKTVQGVINSIKSILPTTAAPITPATPTPTTPTTPAAPAAPAATPTPLAATNTQLDTTTKQIVDRKAYAETPEGKAAYDAAVTKANNVNTITADQQAQINQAGAMEASKWTSLISDATEKARQGRASNLVAAAKNGGLDSSAWAGISSLVGVPNGGATGFEGAGGKLASMGVEYDKVVTDLQAKQLQASTAAQQAERKALLSQNADDWTRAKDLYTIAKDAYDDSTTMLNNKETVLRSYADHLKTGLQDAADRIKTIGSVGATVSTEDKKAIDDYYGAGFTDKYMATAKKAADAKTQDEQLSAAKDWVSILKDLPAGQEHEFPPGSGTKYKGIGNTSDSQTWMEVDPATNKRVIIEYNKTTNEVTVTQTDVTGPAKKTGSPTDTKTKPFPDQFSAWYETTFKVKPARGEKAAEEEYTRWVAEGGAAGVAKREKETENPHNYTPAQLGKIRAAGVDPKDATAADALLYPKTKKSGQQRSLDGE